MLRIALVLLILGLPAAAAPARPAAVLPLDEIVRIVTERYQGRLLAARFDAPQPFEFALGADLIHELTLISPQGNIILIRLDAVSGRVLDVRGRDLIAARRPAAPSTPPQ